MQTMKLTVAGRKNGKPYYTYIDGAHTFTIEQRYVSGLPNCKGHDIYHTGPRPDIAAERRARRAKIGNPADDNVKLNKEPINLLKTVKAEIALFLLAIAEAEAVAAPRKGATKSVAA